MPSVSLGLGYCHDPLNCGHTLLFPPSLLFCKSCLVGATRSVPAEVMREFFVISKFVPSHHSGVYPGSIQLAFPLSVGMLSQVFGKHLLTI